MSALLPVVSGRGGVQQSLRIWVGRPVQDRRAACRLDEAPRVYYEDVVGKSPGDIEVVRDEEDGESILFHRAGDE